MDLGSISLIWSWCSGRHPPRFGAAADNAAAEADGWAGGFAALAAHLAGEPK